MASQEFENIVSLLRAIEPPPDVDIGELRLGYIRLGALVPPATDVAVETAEVAGIPGDWLSPPGSEDEAGRTILYLHGGGYVIGSPASHRSMLTHLAIAARARVFAADYRLAPEHVFPAAVDDAVEAYKGLLDSGIDPSELAIAGDSAGGGLTLATLLRLRDEGVSLPATAIVISPWVDLTQSGETIRTIGDTDVLVKPAMLDRWTNLYAADVPADSPLVSPLFGDLKGLPPLLIHVGSAESLLDDSLRLADRARAAGVDVELVVADNMIHVWHFFAGMASECDDAITAVGDWIIEHTS